MSKVELHLGDCIEFMRGMPDGCVDMVIFSPPYNVGVKYGDKEWTNDRLDIQDYKNNAERVMDDIFPVLVSGGRVCVEIGGSGRNLPLSWIWADAAYKVGFGLFSEIMIPHRKTNPTAWGSWLRADNVFTIPNFHSLYVFYKDTSEKKNGITVIDKSEFTEWTRGVWNINYSIGKVNEHPATFPIELPTRCIKLFGHDADTIFDPFMGSGTTGIACVQLGRNFIGCEIDPGYFSIAEKRIAQAQLQPPLFTVDQPKVEQAEMELTA